MDLESRGIVLPFYIAITEALMSFAVTVNLICVFKHMHNVVFLMIMWLICLERCKVLI